MTEWAADWEHEETYLELRTLIAVYAGLEPQKVDKEPAAIWCANCQRAFHETVTEHLTRHLGQEFGWTSTPPPTYG